ncbi:MAG TPA: glycosyltransferase family 2 protein [Steroidobacteraceae bacterium]|jgi:cellulose synthase/poly-beta-1,6-N-acetylglucosamine synthase-like glycosyltransferase|nr:glycosyltransferase family 2 protein [Steroidobacteraceae bacterium]
MRTNPDSSLILAAVILVCVAGVAAAASAGLLSGGTRVVIFLFVNLILVFDVIDLIVRLWLRKLHGAAAEGPAVALGLPEISNAERALDLSPYAIIASLHDEADDTDRIIATLLPFKEAVWLIDDASSDDTLVRLRREGWNCVAGGVNRKKPAALRHLLETLPAEIQTVVVMDPDVRWLVPPGMERPTLERVISDLQRSGAAACTPRVQARRGGWLEECQAFEYELACGLGRKSLGELCCNSGVSVYRRGALEAALNRHSLSVYAEDFENSLLLLEMGERIYYDDRLIIETQAKSSWNHLLSQRVGWAFGCAKVIVERLPQIFAIARRGPLGAYQYVFYLCINGVLLLPLKLVSTALLAMSLLKALDDLVLTQWLPLRPWNEPLLFCLWYCKSAVILLLACLAALPRGERRRHLATVPFYCFYGLLQYIPTVIGYLNWLALRIRGRRIYADHYDDDAGCNGSRTVVPTGGLS